MPRRGSGTGRSEWGAMQAVETKDLACGDVEGGSHVLLWRDDGGGAEFRMSVLVRLETRGYSVSLRFDVPRLYRQSGFPTVAALGKAGLPMKPSDVAMLRVAE